MCFTSITLDNQIRDISTKGITSKIFFLILLPLIGLRGQRSVAIFVGYKSGIEKRSLQKRDFLCLSLKLVTGHCLYCAALRIYDILNITY